MKTLFYLFLIFYIFLIVIGLTNGDNENDFSNKLKEKIDGYNKKYKNIFNDIFELEINGKKSFYELLYIIFNKCKKLTLLKFLFPAPFELISFKKID